MKERNLQFDVARVLSMMWIVFVWHLSEYLDKDVRNILLFDGAYNVTTVALGTFMFISGYFLSKYKFENANDVKQFYLKRLKRFYFLFMLAAITMWIGGMNPENRTLITTLTGLSSFILPQPRTLWFFSMLMFFYFITPLLQSVYNALKIKSITYRLGGGIHCRVYFIYNQKLVRR